MMSWILGAIGFIAVLVLTVVLTIYFSLQKNTVNSESSKYIINKFEPDNTAPKITELIEYHKSHETIHYKIEDGNGGQ